MRFSPVGYKLLYNTLKQVFPSYYWLRGIMPRSGEVGADGMSVSHAIVRIFNSKMTRVEVPIEVIKVERSTKKVFKVQ